MANKLPITNFDNFTLMLIAIIAGIKILIDKIYYLFI